MSYCQCDTVTDVRATSECGGEDYLYLRCNHCHGKLARVRTKEELLDALTDPTVAGETVTLRFEPNDSPWMWE